MKTKMLAACLAAVTIATSPAASAQRSKARAERAAAHDYLAGEPGNPREPAILVTITMQETFDGKMLFAPERVTVPTGQQVRFVLTNYGAVDHAFVIGTDGEAKERDVQTKPPEPNARLVPAASVGELLWRFSKPGRYEFASVLPGQYAAGMKGTIEVGAKASEE